MHLRMLSDNAIACRCSLRPTELANSGCRNGSYKNNAPGDGGAVEGNVTPGLGSHIHTPPRARSYTGEKLTSSDVMLSSLAIACRPAVSLDRSYTVNALTAVGRSMRSDPNRRPVTDPPPSRRCPRPPVGAPPPDTNPNRVNGRLDVDVQDRLVSTAWVEVLQASRGVCVRARRASRARAVLSAAPTHTKRTGEAPSS